ncbi:MAG: hypothetical protein R2864_09005 [Syntrophotaleaceae bacterium]
MLAFSVWFYWLNIVMTTYGRLHPLLSAAHLLGRLLARCFSASLTRLSLPRSPRPPLTPARRRFLGGPRVLPILLTGFPATLG